MTAKYRNTPKGRIAPNGYRLCDPLPEGQVLVDFEKKHWVIGKTIGLGGFGEIYLIYEKDSPSKQYVMKLDNINGPLFVEVNFVLRACQQSTINAFMQKRNLSFLGIPRFISSGTHQSPNGGYRFLIMDRLGEELQKVLETKRLSIAVTCRIACRIIDALEYIHDQGYIHADIKAQNILRSPFPKNESKTVTTTKKKRKSSPGSDPIEEDDHYYLIDYGLVEKYTLQGVHKPYEFDKRKANNGTCEFRSRDAHMGVISRRSDIESLGYNLILWFYGRHPWGSFLKDADKVFEKKKWAMENITEFLKESFNNKPSLEQSEDSSESKSSKSANKVITKKSIPFNTTPPKGLHQFFDEINRLSHDDRPDYARYKKILEDIAKLNPKMNLSTSCTKSSPKRNRLSNTDVSDFVEPKIKKPNKSRKVPVVDNDINGDVTESDDTEIEDVTASTQSSKTTRTTAKQSSTPMIKTNVANKNSNKKPETPVSNRILRNRGKGDLTENGKIDLLDELIVNNNNNSSKKSTSDKSTPRRPSGQSTTLIWRTPGTGDSPLFGPFEPEESLRDNDKTLQLKNSRNKKSQGKSGKVQNGGRGSGNDENSIDDKQFNSCRIYINNKRCRPRQSFDENDFDETDYQDSDYLLSTSTESLNYSENDLSSNQIKSLSNGKHQSQSSSKRTNVSNVGRTTKTNGTNAKTTATSTTTTSSKRSRKNNNKAATNDNGKTTTSVPETAAMQRVRMMMQNKNKKK